MEFVKVSGMNEGRLRAGVAEGGWTVVGVREDIYFRSIVLIRCGVACGRRGNTWEFLVRSYKGNNYELGQGRRARLGGRLERGINYHFVCN